MIASFKSEYEKLRRRPAVWILFGIWMLLVTAFAYVIPYIIYVTPSADTGGTPRSELLGIIVPHAFVQNILAGVPFFGAALVLIGGTMLAGSEYAWGTLGALFAQRPGRLSVLGGKLLALVSMGFAFTVAAFAIGAIASPIVAAAQNQPQDFPPASQILAGFGISWLVLTAFAFAGLFIAVLFRSASVPVGLGLVYLLVIESIIAGFAGSSRVIGVIHEALPGANAGALAKSIITTKSIDAPGLTTMTGWQQSLVVLLLWVVGFVVVSAVLLRRRDVTGMV
jgi:ABC-type transport system involved in multi-copper enzyme maturation permease subunit